MAEIVLIRHGQTPWSAEGRHTSRTDLELTAEGERQARALAGALKERDFAAVLCSPRRRARHTAELAGLRIDEIDDDLAEWDYGEYEGLTTPEIHRRRPGWDLWHDGCPGGELPAQVAERIDRVLARATAALERGDVALVGHGHALRVTGARWAGWPPAEGGRLMLGTATLSTLGHEHGRTAISSWNAGV